MLKTFNTLFLMNLKNPFSGVEAARFFSVWLLCFCAYIATIHQRLGLWRGILYFLQPLRIYGWPDHSTILRNFSITARSRRTAHRPPTALLVCRRTVLDYPLPYWISHSMSSNVRVGNLSSFSMIFLLLPRPFHPFFVMRTLSAYIYSMIYLVI